MAQEMTDKMTQQLKNGEVRPKDKVTVYATDANPFYPSGEAFQVHRALAEKMIASGKAIDKAPTKAATEKK